MTFEVVGVTQSERLQRGFESQNYVPIDAFPDGRLADRRSASSLSVDKEQIPALRRALSGTLGVFVIENAMITRLITSLLGTFTAFPTMVAALGLIVGGVVIANSVALTTMERRREIAVMKSVGLQRERVLFMILLENGILGLIGGLIGVGIGLGGAGRADRRVRRARFGDPGRDGAAADAAVRGGRADRRDFDGVGRIGREAAQRAALRVKTRHKTQGRPIAGRPCASHRPCRRMR